MTYPNAQKKIAVQKEKVLIGLRKGWTESGAARYANSSRTQLRTWRKDDPLFNAKCIDAQEEGLDGLEDIALSRAKRKSDVLMMFMLNGGRPDKFRPKKEEGPTTVTVQVKRFGKEK